MDKKLIILTAVIVGSLATSCSILENRDACPCIAKVTVTQQSSDMTFHGHVDAYIINESSVVASSFTGGLLGGDAMMEMSVWPRASYQLVLSSLPMTDMTVRAEYGKEIDSLFTHVGDINCMDETALYRAENFEKQFTTLDIILSEPTVEYADRIEVVIEGPYDGLIIPSLRASEGKFSVRKKFNAEGECPIRVPRQEGLGATLSLYLDGEENTKYSLVGQMIHYGYNFLAKDLKDMRLVVELNHITGNLNINDWTPVEMGNQDF